MVRGRKRAGKGKIALTIVPLFEPLTNYLAHFPNFFLPARENCITTYSCTAFRREFPARETSSGLALPAGTATLPMNNPYTDSPPIPMKSSPPSTEGVACVPASTYRYLVGRYDAPGGGWVEYKACSHAEALQEASRLLIPTGGTAEMRKLEIWNVGHYLPVALVNDPSPAWLPAPSGVSTLPESKDAPEAVSVASTTCPDCGHPFTAGYHMAGEACPAPSPSPLSVPTDVQPDARFQMWWENSKRPLAGMEPYFFAKAGFHAAETLLEADVARLSMALENLASDFEDWTAFRDADQWETLQNSLGEARALLSSLSKGDKQ